LEEQGIDGIRMDLRETGWECRFYPGGSKQGLVAGCCEYGDEPSGSGATELVRDDVLRLRGTPPLVSFWLVCWS
jgi:hypothetical protein